MDEDNGYLEEDFLEEDFLKEEENIEERKKEDYEKIYRAYSEEKNEKADKKDKKGFLQLAVSILFFLFIAYLIVRFIFGAWISIFLFMMIFSVLAAFTYLTFETY